MVYSVTLRKALPQNISQTRTESVLLFLWSSIILVRLETAFLCVCVLLKQPKIDIQASKVYLCIDNSTPNSRLLRISNLELVRVQTGASLTQYHFTLTPDSVKTFPGIGYAWLQCFHTMPPCIWILRVAWIYMGNIYYVRVWSSI